jgi:hypothetical protein
METLNKLLEVIDSNSQDMPEGVYLQLMNLLKEQHKELNNNKNVVINEPVQQVEEPVQQVQEQEPQVVQDDYERIKVKNLQVGDIITDFKDYKGDCYFKVVKVTNKTISAERCEKVEISSVYDDYYQGHKCTYKHNINKLVDGVCKMNKEFIFKGQKGDNYVTKFNGNTNEIITTKQYDYAW